MKIILLEDVKKHGKKGDIINVKDGFGMNYLVKNNLGIVANNVSLSKLEKENQELKKEMAKSKQKAEDIKAKLEKETFIFKVKVGKQDKVFGSISSKQIEEALREKNYEVDKKKIKIETPLISLGTHTVQIELYKEVIGNIKIKLVKEGE